MSYPFKKKRKCLDVLRVLFQSEEIVLYLLSKHIRVKDSNEAKVLPTILDGLILGPLERCSSTLRRFIIRGYVFWKLFVSTVLHISITL